MQDHLVGWCLTWWETFQVQACTSCSKLAKKKQSSSRSLMQKHRHFRAMFLFSCLFLDYDWPHQNISNPFKSQFELYPIGVGDEDYGGNQDLSIYNRAPFSTHILIRRLLWHNQPDNQSLSFSFPYSQPLSKLCEESFHPDFRWPSNGVCIPCDFTLGCKACKQDGSKAIRGTCLDLSKAIQARWLGSMGCIYIYT